MTSSLITSWQMEGEKVEVVTDFLLLGSKSTADDDSNHEIKKIPLLGIYPEETKIEKHMYPIVHCSTTYNS